MPIKTLSIDINTTLKILSQVVNVYWLTIISGISSSFGLLSPGCYLRRVDLIGRRTYVLCISLCFTKICPSWVPSWYRYLCCVSGLWSLTSSSLWKLLSKKWKWISVSSWTFLWSLNFSSFVKDLTQEWQTNANSQKIFPIEKMIPGKTGAGCQLCDPISGICPRYTALFFI